MTKDLGLVRLSGTTARGVNSLPTKEGGGKIHSDMPLSVAGSMGSDSINGTIGDGKCPLTLANSNGNIDLLKGK